MDCVPSIREGNDKSHSIGLGQMNLHGYLGKAGIAYDSVEALDFVRLYFATVNYHSIMASNKLAQEHGEVYDGFWQSTYATGEYFEPYVNDVWEAKTKKVRQIIAETGLVVPSAQDWVILRNLVKSHGLFNAYRLAVPPTGSISYVNNSTSSIHPIAAKIEVRKEGKLGRVYYAAPHMTDENMHLFKDAYEIGPYAIIDVYAEATKHTDQGLSLTLFFKSDATTQDINRAHIYAFKKGIKTVYYIRLRQDALEGTEVENCVSCQL